MKIKIIAGTYGFRPDGGSRVAAVNIGETCDVPSEEAKRLVALGVAQYSSAEAVATGAAADGDGGADAHLDPEQLQTMTTADLRKLADDMGIDTAKLKKKAQLIAAIADVPLENAIAVADGDGDGEVLPEIEPEAPVV